MNYSQESNCKRPLKNYLNIICHSQESLPQPEVDKSTIADKSDEGNPVQTDALEFWKRYEYGYFGILTDL